MEELYGEDVIYECPICIVESEIHMVQALEDIKKAGCNTLVVYLGNFGPEISETLLSKHFGKTLYEVFKYIGVDLGTSAVKLLLMDEKGNIKKV